MGQPEPVLQAGAIRRADWRYLLPDPKPERTFCRAAPDLVKAVAWLSGRLVDAGETCDLAVLSDPDARSLNQAWKALRPGGACYCEWNRPYPGTQLLEAAGFTGVHSYIPWPRTFGKTTLFWLPADDDKVVRHFLATREAGRSLRTRARRSLLPIFWQVARRGHFLYPVCSVGRKPGFEDLRSEEQAVSAQASQDLLTTLQSDWEGLNLGPKPRHLNWVLITAGQHSLGKVVGMVFAGREKAPCLVVKLPRVSESIPSLNQEAEVLQAVQEKASGAGGAPRFLFKKEWGGFPVLGESALSGLPLYRVLNWKNAKKLALQATQWLAVLAGKQPAKPEAEWRQRLVEPVLAEFQRDYQAVIEAGKLRAARTRLDALPALPLTIEQRDFSPWNVLIDSNGELAVLDWESGEAEGLAGMDLVYFLTYLAFFLEKTMPPGNFLATYRRLLDPSSPTGELAQDCWDCYTSQTGFSQNSLPGLRVLAWMKHALSEYNQLTQEKGSPPGAEALRSSMFLSLWNEELKNAPG
ncbi:MAG: phosphotransferase family protein [Omnitrophica WOR_2 bacterium]